MYITRLLPEHLDEWGRIEQASFPDPWSYAQMAEELSREDAWYAALMEDGRLIGYGGMYIVLDEGNITNVAVDKPFRRNNGGRMIIEAIVNEALSRKLSFVTLEVRESNLPAVRLYEVCGFSRVGVRRGYYQRPVENAILMTRVLASEDAEERP